MAPGAKRKRGDRTYSQDDSQRQSPHNPNNTALAQSNHYGNGGSRNNGRRGSRGNNRSGSSQQQPPRSPTVQSPSNAASPAASRAMSPPPPKDIVAKPAYAPSQPAAPSDIAAPSLALKPDSPPYHYDYLTNERKQSWQASGRRDFVNAALQLQGSGDDIDLGVLFQELITAALTGRLTGQEAGATIKEILEKSTNSEAMDLPSLFLDNLSIVAEASQSTDAVLGVLLRNSNISPSLIRIVLDASLLEALGFVRSTFSRMGIRASTNILYRQSAFNLLREETEGYAKLITEYFTVTGSMAYSKEVVEETYEKIMALIGAFDLDVGRVLDVTLDVFANNLVKHYRFFIKFLQISCWWPEQQAIAGYEREDQGFDSLSGLEASPEDKERLAALKEERDVKFWDRVRDVGMAAFFELGGRRALTTSEMSDMLNGEATDDDKKEASEAKRAGDKEWIVATGTYPPQGNSTAAQLLGFKLRFYASQARDANDTLPPNLIWVAALLIKLGFISFRDLYPHLYPADEDMDKLKAKLLKEKQENQKKSLLGGGDNALTRAKPLAEGEPERSGPPGSRLRDTESRSTPSRQTVTSITSSAPKAEPEDKEKLPEPEDQKISLLRSLLLIGAIPEALYMLGRFPWLLDLYSDLPKYIFRILHHSLQKVYADTQPLADRPSLRTPKQLVSDTMDTKLSKGQLLLGDRPVPKVKFCANLESTDYDPSGQEHQTDWKFYWSEWSDNVPVCQNVEDVFTLCSTLLNLVGVKIGRDAELLLKLTRIAKRSLQQDNSDGNVTRWRDLAKRVLVPALSLSRTNPGLVNEVFAFLRFFPTSTRYNIYAEWFTGPSARSEDMKDAFAQVTKETKDVLKRISKKNTKTMAKHLAKVSHASPGIVFMVTLSQIESYNNLIDVVVDCAKNLTFLGYDVLTWALLNALGGPGRDRMQGDGMLTSLWLKALSEFAGKVFRRYKQMDPSPILQYVADQLRRGKSDDLEVLIAMVEYMAGVNPDTNMSEEQCMSMAGKTHLQSQTLQKLGDKRHQSKDQSKRLLEALTSTRLAGPLLVTLAEERQLYPYRDQAADAPVKVVSSNISKLHDAMIQYLDLVRTNLSVEQFDAAVPNIATLISKLGIDRNVVFAICRPSIQYHMDKADQAAAAAKTAEDSERSDSEGAVINGDVEMTDVTTKAVSRLTNGTEDVMMKDTSPPDTSFAISEPRKAEDVLHPVLRDVMSQIEGVLPEGFTDSMSLPFYVRFWQLSLSDLVVPPYDLEVKALRLEIEGVNRDRTDVSSSGMKKKEVEKARLLGLIDNITSEFKAHIKHRETIKKTIPNSGERDFWFTDFATCSSSKQRALIDAIIQECLWPRIVLSPTDALFASNFVFWVHRMGTPGFRLIHIFDHLFNEKKLNALIFQCTEKEAKNLGHFINKVLHELRRWHGDAVLYEKENPNKDSKAYAKQLPWQAYRRILTKWHQALNATVTHCLNSGEYMHIRNAFQLLKAIHEQFPALNFHGNGIHKAVQELSDKDPRDDIKLSATSLLGDLLKHRKDWVPIQAFRENLPGQSDIPASAQSNTTPQPAVASKPLNANAPEFKPPSSVNGIKPTGKVDAEDGEIEDGKEADKAATPGAGNASATSTTLKPERQRQDRSKTPDVNSAPPLDRAGSQRTAQASYRADSRPATPVGTSAPSASRGDSNRTTSQLPAARPPNLPNKPGGPLPSERLISHRTERSDGRPQLGRSESRPNEQFGRLDRPGEGPRELMRRREASPGGHRSGGRTPEGHSMVDRDRRDPGYGPRDPRDLRDLRESRDPRDPRDLRDIRDPRGPPHLRDSLDNRDLRDGRDVRDSRDYHRQPPRDSPRDLIRDGRPDSRGPEWEPPRGRAGPDSHGPPVPYDSRNRQQAPSSMRPPVMTPREQGPPVNPERAAQVPLTSQPATVPVNPERLALINQELSRDQQRDQREASRKAELSSRIEREREAGRVQRSSGPQSPRRTDERPPPRTEPSLDERRNERAPNSDRPTLPPPVSTNSRDQREDVSGPPPSGPRNEQLSRGSGAGRGRELFQPQQAAPRPPLDPNHGRLNTQGFDHRTQDPNYGRLNAAPEVPSGPRGRGNMQQRGGRNFTAPQAPGGPRTMEPSSPLQMPLSPNQERLPPSGPLSDRDRRDRRQTAGADQTQAPASAPHGPAADQSTGIHPSRLNQINPLQVNVPTAPANHGPSAAAPFAPSGPRSAGHRQIPSMNTNVPSPTSRNPPTGPSSATGPGPKEDVRFAGMKNHLIKAQIQNQSQNQAQNQGASVRGQASRNNNNNNRFPQQNNVQLPVTQDSSPQATRQEAHPTSDPLKRSDLMADQPSHTGPGLAENPGGEERSDSRGGRRREGGNDRRRHRSRSRSPRRGAVENSIRQREEPPPRGDRERRHDGPGSDRDDKAHRRSRGGGREERDKDRDGGSGRERDRRESRNNAAYPPIPPPPPPPPEERRPSRGGNNGERRNDDRDRSSRRDDGNSGRNRKRGHNGGGDEMEPKRPRRTQ